jgi:hypothetical protein
MFYMGEGHPYWSVHLQYANNMAVVGRGDEKSIPAVKRTFSEMADFESILGSF